MEVLQPIKEQQALVAKQDVDTAGEGDGGGNEYRIFPVRVAAHVDGLWPRVGLFAPTPALELQQGAQLCIPCR